MKAPGFKEVKGKHDITKPLEIEDLELAWKSDKEGNGLYIFTNFDEDAFEYIKKFNPKFVYSPKEDGSINDEIPNLKRVKIGEFKSLRGTSPFYVREGKLGNQKVVVVTPDPVFGGGDVVLTQKESPELVKMAEDFLRGQSEAIDKVKKEHFSFFSNIKSQLTDAPTEVKKSFNTLVNYFSGKNNISEMLYLIKNWSERPNIDKDKVREIITDCYERLSEILPRDSKGKGKR